VLILFFFTNLVFLLILFYYQQREKIYAGYTTVLGFLFGALLVFSAVARIFHLGMHSGTAVTVVLILSNWILGSVLIYVTSQLTLAFEKIQQLAQHIALRETGEEKEERHEPLPAPPGAVRTPEPPPLHRS
jgi:prolipoprotein diacylglyceryltransferase